MANGMLLAAVAAFFVVAVSGQAYKVKQPEITTLGSKGIKFTYKKDDPGLSMVAFHFNVNKALAGVEASQYAADVSTVTDGAFVYTEPNVEVRVGDKVNYWVYALVNGAGYLLTDQTWVNDGGVTTTTTPKTTKTTTPKTTTTRTTTAPYTGPTTTPPDCSACPCESKAPQELKCTSYPCLIFDEEFDKLDLNVWEHEITAGGGGNWEFQYYHNNRTNSYVKDGILYIKPTLTEEKFGKDSVTKANTVLELWGTEPANLCTGNQWWGCRRETHGSNIINPIQSARLRTVNSFSFRYGRLEVEAKLPKGDWIWPAIWLLPRYQVYGGWPASGEIDLMESRGNTDLRDKGVNIGVSQFGSTLHYGPYWPENGWEKAHATYNLPSGTFNDDFHKFGLNWDQEGLTFSVDGNDFLHVETNDGYWKRGQFDTRLPEQNNVWTYGGPDAPFDQEFYIILNVAVGGTGGYFPDSAQNAKSPKPWRDTSSQAAFDFWQQRSQWYPTWPQGENEDDRAMQIKSIKVWKDTPEQDRA